MDVDSEVTVKLTLNFDEAYWLMGLTQNYLGEDPSHEPHYQKRYRETLFLALQGRLRGYKAPQERVIVSGPEPGQAFTNSEDGL